MLFTVLACKLSEILLVWDYGLTFCCECKMNILEQKSGEVGVLIDFFFRMNTPFSHFGYFPGAPLGSQVHAFNFR